MPRTAPATVPMPPAVHPERDALLAAIRANPHADLPRLVYADWQEEHGQPEHAELIRLQCEIKRLTRRTDTARRRELRARVREVLRRPALAVLGEEPDERDYDRGFLPRVVVAGPMWEPYPRWDGPSVIWMREPRRWTMLAFDDASPGMPVDRMLDLRVEFAGPVDREAAAVLAGCAWLARASVLGCGPQLTTFFDARPLADSPHLGGVRELNFHQTLHAAAVVRLVLARTAVRLTAVRFDSFCRVTARPNAEPSPAALAAAVRRIGRSRRAGQLTELRVESPDTTDEVAAAVMDCPRLRRLPVLVLAAKRLSEPVRAALASWRGRPPTKSVTSPS
jgi:uncharacterized protein (TIGR02996 family)